MKDGFEIASLNWRACDRCKNKRDTDQGCKYDLLDIEESLEIGIYSEVVTCGLFEKSD